MNDSTKDSDSELFRQAMQDVEPLPADNRVRRRPQKKAVRVSAKPRHADIEDVLSDAPVADCPQTLDFSRSGVQPSTLKKLRQGKIPLQHRIDLHGMSVDQAREYLLSVLAECEHDGSRCILIVHGKGYSSPGARPVIKPLLNRWLRQLPMVLAFHSALPADGGSGAVYVLLKNKRSANGRK